MIYFVTGNIHKFKTAQDHFGPLGIDLVQKVLDIPEVQSESIEEVATDKAKKAFEQIKQPLFINDAGWMIPALNGFPGPFMKYMIDWLSSEDFINLMKGRENRQVILRQVLVYIDKTQTKVFIGDCIGKILEEVRGKDPRPINNVASFLPDGLSIYEEQQLKGKMILDAEVELWKSFSDWLEESDLH